MNLRTLSRLRFQRVTWPRPALILTDTPRPDCPDCEGIGGFEYDYGNSYDGEYEGTDWEPCTCWNEARRWVVLPLPRLPRWLHRRSDTVRDPWGPDDYSNEPPF
ncbi:hypothetical protein OG496_18830 [Streptomyces sp. NBC_00988]|uniref:hypothetical protein n=1 Tax=Streptomyces sp. NBC_00988 TaxID=2903704 RepID=UPI00386A9E27|nr:hypothetical protein OG496_18830 [Streptomyces sp. NBC_00988]